MLGFSAVKTRPQHLVLAALLGLVLALPARGDVFVPKFMHKPSVTMDAGRFTVHLQDRALGDELFNYTEEMDSLIIVSHYRQPLKNGDTLHQSIQIVAGKLDYDLSSFQSTMSVGAHKVVRGIGLGDTVITLYREDETGGGDGYTFVRPPGRLFAIESNSYVLFDIMSRTLAKHTVERWPLQVVALGERDTIMEIVAKSQPSETIKWGNGPITARKWSLSDGQTTFLMWIGPQNYMIRLEQPQIGLRVERQPPPVRQAKSKSSSSGS